MKMVKAEKIISKKYNSRNWILSAQGRFNQEINIKANV